jgi:hypothetical protein
MGPGVQHLRVELHRAEPFKWQFKDCALCISHGIVWEDTAAGSFPDHAGM